MRIRLNKLHFPVTSLGPGRRVGIWLQGCSVGCPGCVSRDTWLTNEKSLVDIDVIIDWCRKQTGGRPDGVTISGGEPFEQPTALLNLLNGLSSWRRDAELSIDFLCYSGLPFACLQRDFANILAHLDAVIPEPFLDSRPSKRPWRGSTNQPLIPLSNLGHNRYDPFIDMEITGKKDFQIEVQGGRIWFVGIPSRGDMQKLEEACRSRGIVPENVSWRA
jgi:anaerobic ribonucleoside-triphosphate reductase activating protein